MSAVSKLSTSLEDYLETIFILNKKKGEIRITDIANTMEISKPSVNKAVSVLKNQGLLTHQKYGEIKLTQQGIDLAESIYFKHNILVDFFTKKLGISRDVAEKDACKIEHVISAETLEKLIEYSLR